MLLKGGSQLEQTVLVTLKELKLLIENSHFLFHLVQNAYLSSFFSMSWLGEPNTCSPEWFYFSLNLIRLCRCVDKKSLECECLFPYVKCCHPGGLLKWS